MKFRKKPILASLFMIFLVSVNMVAMVPMINVTSASPGTHFYVDPSEVKDLMPPDGKFKIYIRIAEAPRTYAWELRLSWNPTLLELTYIKEGEFLRRGGAYPTSFMYINLTEANPKGEILVGCSLIGSVEPASGDGLLVTLGFIVEAVGSCVLNLFETSLQPQPYVDYIYYPNQDSFFYNKLLHDIAVNNVASNVTEVTPGDPVTINVTVTNEGNYTETFKVAVYADTIAFDPEDPDAVLVGDEITIGTYTVTNLGPGATNTTTITWDTSEVASDTYTLSAEALIEDDDTRDNTFIDGTVTFLVPHDLKIVEVVPNMTEVKVGYPVSINVTVLNQGTESESFTLYVYTNETIIDIIDGSLGARASYTYNILWDTTGVVGEPYTISAKVPPVLGEREVDTIDNTFINGEVTVRWNHDLKITHVTVISPEVLLGELAKIAVTVLNQGSETEKTFDVYAYADLDPTTLRDEIILGPQTYDPVWGLISGESTTLTFTWNTTGVKPGTYTTSAEAIPVSGEVDPNIADNFFTHGTITVSLVPRHDIAVTDVTPSPKKVCKGQSVLISVAVKNEGNVKETFTVTAYYDEIAIETKNVTDLIPGGLTTLSFYWNTIDVAVGNYTIKAKTGTVPEEIDVADNELVYDGFVEVSPVVHDIAITSVTASPTTIVVGGTVSIEVTAKNEGSVVETFIVISYYDTTPAAPSQTVTELGPSESETLEFTWNTTGAALGNYTVKAEAPPVTGEIDVADNTYTDGMVTLTVHDVAVISITANPTLVSVGQSVTISVTVKNEGNYTESFSVTSKYDNTIIGTTNVADLAEGGSKTLSFTWNTAGVAGGTYTISANVSVISGETDTADNTYTDGTVNVKEISTISISVDPATFTIGESTDISGFITPTREEVTVTIWYRLSGEQTWNILETMATDENSEYSHDWTPTAAGRYEVKASWAGDANTLGDESDVQTIEVQEAPATLGIALYAVAGIAIVIAAAIIIYMLKFRKSS